MPGRTLLKALLSVAITGAMVGVGAPGAGANSDTTNNAPLSCTTSPDVGNQSASWNSTVTDDHDPAAVGDAITYTFVVPFKEAATPVAATYKGGKTYYNIPTGLHVTSVSTQTPPGGSQIHSTAAISGSQIIVTSTANVPIDGSTYTTDNLVVNGTVTSAAAGPGVNWKIPAKVIANVFINGFGTITATCTPNSPSTVIATTTVPGASSGPTATNKTVTASSGAPTKITLSGTSPKGYPLTFSIATNPAHGTLTGTAPVVSYTSAAGYAGADSFTFKVDDGHGGSAIGTVTLKVVAGPVIDNTPPTIQLTSPSHGAVYAPTSAVKAAFSCADATTSVASCTGTVANGAAVSLSVGLHTFVVKAVDAQGNKAQTLVSYRVINPAPAPQHYTGAARDTVAITCDNSTLTPTTLPVAVSAPTQVPVGGTFSMNAAAGEQSVPTELEYTNLHYTIAAPVGATITGAAVIPGTGSANASPGASAAVTNGMAVLTVPGPIDGHTTSATNFTAPAMRVTMKANGKATTTANTKFVAFVYTRGAAGLPGPTQTVTCPATSPTPMLTHTTILDVTPPIATLTAPTHGAVYNVGQKVVVKYACSDAVALASCHATQANGTVVPTNKPGKYMFVVDALDNAGNHSEAFASYVVVGAGGSVPGAPTITGTFAGDRWVSVAWNAPTVSGTSAVSSYTVTAAPGGATAQVPAPGTRAIVTGLNDGTAYRFTVTATNASGTSAPSVASASTTPVSGTVVVVTKYTSGEMGRLRQNAAYFRETVAQAQHDSVGIIAYIVGQIPPGPTPLSPPPANTGPSAVGSHWSTADQSALRTVATKFALSPAETQKVSVLVVGYLLSLNGH